MENENKVELKGDVRGHGLKQRPCGQTYIYICFSSVYGIAMIARF